MFSKISQIGKNLTDEFSRINEEVQTARKTPSGIDQEAAERIIQTKTPDPDTLTQPEDVPVEDETVDTSSSSPVGSNGPDAQTPVTDASPSPAPVSLIASRTATPENTAGAIIYVPNTNVKLNDLNPEIRSRMRKFIKYEEKYPILLDSYKTEKKKTAIISHFEKVLQETTPCSSIADGSGLKQYLNNLTSKTDMLSTELRAVTTAEKKSNEEKEKLKSSVQELKKSSFKLESELKDKISSLESEIAKMQSNSQTKGETIEENSAQDEEIDSLKTKIEQLEKANSELRETHANDISSLQGSHSTEIQKLKDSNDLVASQLKENNTKHLAHIEALKVESAKKITESKRTLEMQNKDMESELSQSRKRTTELEAEVSSLTETVKRSKSELESTVASNKKLGESYQSEIASLVEKLKAASSTASAVEKEDSSVSPVVDSSNTSTAPLSASQKKKQKKKQKKQQQQPDEDELTETAAVESKDIVADAVTDQSSLIELKHNYEVLQSKFEKLEGVSSELDGLKQEHFKLKKDFDELTTSSSKEIETKSKELSELRSEVDTLTIKVSEYKRSLSEKDEEIEGLKQDLIEVGNDLVTAKDNLKEEQAKKSVNDEEESEKVKELKSELEVLWLQNSSAVTDYEKEQASLNRKLEVAISEKKIAETELTSVRKKITDLNKRNIDSENQADLLKKDVKKKNAEIEALNEQIKNLQNSAAVSSKSIVGEKEALSKELQIVKQEKETLEKKVKELSDYKSSDVNFKLEIASLKTSLTYKEKALTESESKIKFLEEQKNTINDNFIELKVEVSELKSQNKTLNESKNVIVTKNENLKQQYNDLILKMNKISADNNKLLKTVEEYKDRYNEAKDSKNSNSVEADSLKRRCDELLMKSKEDEDRIEVLEEELSEVRSMLQERTRETGTMRKLLVENEESQNNKLKEITAQLNRISEEKEKLDSEFTVVLKKRQKEIDDLKMKYDKLSNDFEVLSSEKSDLETKMRSLTSQSANGARSPVPFTSLDSNGFKPSDESSNDKLVEALRDSLSDTENRIRNLETVNNNLKKSHDESLQKLIRLNKKYKLLYQQYKTTRTARKSSISEGNDSDLSHPPSPLGSRTNSIVLEHGRSNSIIDFNKSLEEVKESEEEAEKEKIMYIKNVLLGFLEHKDQRAILLPVIKTLLYLNDNDERKLVSCLAK